MAFCFEVSLRTEGQDKGNNGFSSQREQTKRGLILLVFTSWTTFLTFLRSPPLRSGRKQRKGNKRISTSGFFSLQEKYKQDECVCLILCPLDVKRSSKVHKRAGLSEQAESSVSSLISERPQLRSQA